MAFPHLLDLLYVILRSTHFYHMAHLHQQSYAENALKRTSEE